MNMDYWTPDRLLLYCRPGFEGECAAEIQARAEALGHHGYSRTRPNSAWLSFVTLDAAEAIRLAGQLRFGELTFPRQLILAAAPLIGLPVTDRLSPLLDALPPGPFSAVWVETADTNEDKALSAFCRKFTVPLERALRARGLLVEGDEDRPRLHVFFQGSATATVGLSDPTNAAPWPRGIPRLRLSREAPSRSALKLEEALHTFLTPTQRRERLQPGMTAVDLGAAPGGWSWQLVRRHLRVTAVDNGPLDCLLLESGLVEHRREDGFRYRPPRPVDWMVCDMVEQPIRVARLVSRWLAEGHCRECIFNLKLPMKQRFAEVLRCREAIANLLEERPHRLQIKQLYHDREEVTGYLRVT